MTQAQASYSILDGTRRAARSAGNLASLVAKLAFGALLIVAAGVIAITTAIFGIIIAFFAILLSLIMKAGGAKTASPRDANGSNDILEARRTSHGWTVDR